MLFTKSAVSFSILFISTISAVVPLPDRPYISRRAIAKRANPTIGGGIDVNDPHRGGKLVPRPDLPTSGAFSNALQLMNYATTLPGTKNDAVFRKYFNMEDRQVVMDVFNRLLGDDQSSGAAALANIKVIAGDNDPNDPAPAALEGFHDPDPNLILSEDAWVYPDRDENPHACADWDDEGMTQDMYLLGSVLLHEYTHWDWFLGSIHGGDVIDQPNGYGWEGARALDKNLAKFNADSYGWYATEFFWAVICGKETGYNAPDVEKKTN